MMSFEFDPAKCTVDALDDHAALGAAHVLALAWSSFGFAELFFGGVEMLDMQKHPSSLLRYAFGGFLELAPRMCPARGQGDAAFAAVRKRGIGDIADALHSATEVGWDDAVQTSRDSTGGTGEADVSSGAFAGPEVAVLGLSGAMAEIRPPPEELLVVLLVPPVNAVIYLLSGLRACHEYCGEGGERMARVFVMAELIYNPILLLIVVHVWSGAARWPL